MAAADAFAPIFHPRSEEDLNSLIEYYFDRNAGEGGVTRIDGRPVNWFRSHSPRLGRMATIYYDMVDLPTPWQIAAAGQAAAPRDASMSGAGLAALAFGGLLFFWWLNRPETRR